MRGNRAAGLLFGLPLACLLFVGAGAAQDSGSTVAKSPPPKAAPSQPAGLTEPEDELRPSLGDETSATGAPPPDDEIGPSTLDEGAGSEAAVEAAQAATPLIGEEQAKEMGIVNEIFPKESFWADVLKYAGQFAPPNKASKAVGMIKRSVQSGAEVPFESGLAIERELQQQLFQSEDAKEGLAAYVEKRTPQFKGR